MGHPNRKALVETAVLALVSVLLLDLAAPLTLVVDQLQPDRPPEEPLGDGDQCGARETQIPAPGTGLVVPSLALLKRTTFRGIVLNSVT